MQADVQPRPAEIGHDVQVAPALQHAEVQARPAEHRMPARGKLGGEFVAQRGCEGQHAIDGVVAPFRLRAMAGPARGLQPDAQDALGGVHHA